MHSSFHSRLILLACLLTIAVCATASAQEQSEPATDDGFTALFDGKTLDGWTQHGGKAKYEVVDGMIVGTTVPNTPNSFLCTEKHYSDFILELDFLVDPVMNSGVQIRSNVYDKPKEYTTDKGKKITVSPGRVHGYQCEIDPSNRAWSGGIYDEGRRGWLDSLADKPEARKAFKQNEWNHFKIKCQGDSIKTWINGVPAADLVDDMTPEGFIALQVHGVGNKTEKLGKQVMWKNIKIKELEAK